jgi:hypothetical protein
VDTGKIGDEYERLVDTLLRLKIYRGGPSAQIEIDQDGVHVERKRVFTGKSGQKHEIDISFELPVAGVSVLFLVECKCYEKAVGVDDLLEFSARLDDIGANKGIFVTNRGFSSGARTIARAKGIGLIKAIKGKWRVVMRAQPMPPSWRYDYCSSNTALISSSEECLTLAFCPIDTRDLLYLEGTPLSSISGPPDIEGGRSPFESGQPSERETVERIIFSIEEQGGSTFSLKADENAREHTRILSAKEIRAIILRSARTL